MNIRKAIIKKLYLHRIIGGKHTAVEHTMSGMPKHLLGDAKKCAEELIKEGLILKKPTAYGIQISLNPDKIDEIIKIVESEN